MAIVTPYRERQTVYEYADYCQCRGSSFGSKSPDVSHKILQNKIKLDAI